MFLFPSSVPLIVVIPYYLSSKHKGGKDVYALRFMLSFSIFPLQSPWGLPFLADDPVSMAKVVMADLAQQKVENKSWPRGKTLLAC